MMDGLSRVVFKRYRKYMYFMFWLYWSIICPNCFTIYPLQAFLGCFVVDNYFTVAMFCMLAVWLIIDIGIVRK